MTEKPSLRTLYIVSGSLILLALLAVSYGYLGNRPQNSAMPIAQPIDESPPIKSDVSSSAVGNANTPGQASSIVQPGYLGSERCGACHQQEFQDWQHSHHDLSMQHASAATVLGDFNNIVFTVAGQQSRFYKKADAFFVRTAGPGGKLADYQILYTFGITPLQQYIVSFADGKLQMLPIAWDTLQNKWFYLQQKLNPQPNEWVYWGNGGMNWNSMCADCHTTNLHKNYGTGKPGYNTTWSAIDVACEACHGPGRAHTEALKQSDYQAGVSDPSIDMQTAEEPQILVDKCGRCHSRRQQLTRTFKHDSDKLLDHYLPAVLRSGLYYSDGQILDEVFVYGSFLQSKMYDNKVSCINCHDAHSAALKAEGNRLCTSCHLASQYDSKDHHHHVANSGGTLKKPGQSAGNQCVDCHMPGRFYMTNDFRRDHSFRVPRPDLSVKYNTPNACNDCHQDKDAEWAAQAVSDWFGNNRKPHFSEVLALSAAEPAKAVDPLLLLLNKQSEPAIARATAAQILTPWMSEQPVRRAMKIALTDQDALLRTIAAEGFAGLPTADKLQSLASLLHDPVRSVRIAAAAGLVEVQPEQLAPDLRAGFKSAKAEYETYLNNNADLPSARYQLAVDYQKQGQSLKAEKAYLDTLAIDDHFNIARMALAQLYYQQRRLPEVEALYRKVIEQEPTAASAHYSLGLLAAELGNFEQAEKSLQTAANSGNNPRAWYNLAVLRQQQKNILGAEQSYLQALAIAPLNADFLTGLVSLYAQQRQWQKLNRLVDNSLTLSPDNDYLLRLKRSIKKLQLQED